MRDKVKVNELFSGIGAQHKALDKIGIDYEIVGISDIDKYANQSYAAMHGEVPQYGDISKVERLEYADLWTYSSPCQDFSVSGKQRGLIDENGNKTRSGLLLEVQRLLKVAKKEGTLPKYLLLENVKNLVGKKFKPDFDRWLQTLDELGYNTYWKVLNAKDYGVPQNRKRVFAVSIRRDLNQIFVFPEKEELKVFIADILESEVDEKYYITDEKAEKLLSTLSDKHISNAVRVGGRGSLDRHTWDLVAIGASRGRNPENSSSETVGVSTEQRFEINSQGTSNTLTSASKDNLVFEVKLSKIHRVPGNLYDRTKEGRFTDTQVGRVYYPDGISLTLDTMCEGNRQPKVLLKGDEPSVILDDTTGYREETLIYPDYAPTLRTTCFGLKTVQNARIRRLTPLECWRLMGFDDEDFYKAKNSGVSDTQLYKQAGNSIVVDVLAKIFENLLK